MSNRHGWKALSYIVQLPKYLLNDGGGIGYDFPLDEPSRDDRRSVRKMAAY
jgi:hypothetical protein